MLSGPWRRLLLPVGLGALALLLWDTWIAYPFRVFVVFLHEVSHGLAALATGGRILAIGLTFDEGGVCITEGGSRFVILNAGYLGSMAWGVALLVLGSQRRGARRLLQGIGVFVLLVTLVYVRSPFGFVYGAATGAALLYVARRFSVAVSEVLLAALGVMSCLYAVWDVASDVLLRSASGSDAAALALLTHIPAVLWGLLWVALSLGAVAATLVFLSRGALGRRR